MSRLHDRMKGPVQYQGDGMEDPDFSEYMWMGEEDVEEFDRKCVEELWEQECMEMVLEEMMQEEEQETVWFTPEGAPAQGQPVAHNPNEPAVVIPDMQGLSVSGATQEQPNQQPAANFEPQLDLAPITQVKPTPMSSTLNPNAPVFVPRCLEVAEGDR